MLFHVFALNEYHRIFEHCWGGIIARAWRGISDCVRNLSSTLAILADDERSIQLLRLLGKEASFHRVPVQTSKRGRQFFTYLMS